MRGRARGWLALSLCRGVAVALLGGAGVALAQVPGVAAPLAPSLAPFTTDGCSRFADRAPWGRADWCHCCVAHDWAYWRGGNEQARLQADQVFKACVQQASGSAWLAQAMFAAVRVGGSPHRNTPFRWGYGWPQGRGYAPLTLAETEQAAALEAQYRSSHPVLACPH
jgi:hypothetical protein